MDTTQIVTFSFGAVLILLLLWMVRTRPNPTAAEYTFTRIVLALACSCAAVVVSGFIEVTISGFVKAGGALAVFVIVFFYQPAALQGTDEWRELRVIWRGRRDIQADPAMANQDDVALAIQTVNEAARIIETNPSLLKPFQLDYAEDYCALYSKLRMNRYHLPHRGTTSDLLLSPAANSLAARLPCRM